MIKTINVAKDFSDIPYGHNEESGGSGNGRAFLEKHLKPAIESGKYEKIIVDFSGVEIFPGGSFLKHSFGSLVAQNIVSRDVFWELFEIVEDEYYTISNRLEPIINEAEELRLAGHFMKHFNIKKAFKFIEELAEKGKQND